MDGYIICWIKRLLQLKFTLAFFAARGDKQLLFFFPQSEILTMWIFFKYLMTAFLSRFSLTALFFLFHWPPYQLPVENYPQWKKGTIFFLFWLHIGWCNSFVLKIKPDDILPFNSDLIAEWNLNVCFYYCTVITLCDTIYDVRRKGELQKTKAAAVRIFSLSFHIFKWNLHHTPVWWPCLDRCLQVGAW